jgi:hypothetical protein
VCVTRPYFSRFTVKVLPFSLANLSAVHTSRSIVSMTESTYNFLYMGLSLFKSFTFDDDGKAFAGTKSTEWLLLMNLGGLNQVSPVNACLKTESSFGVVGFGFLRTWRMSSDIVSITFLIISFSSSESLTVCLNRLFSSSNSSDILIICPSILSFSVLVNARPFPFTSFFRCREGNSRDEFWKGLGGDGGGREDFLNTHCGVLVFFGS